MSKYYDNKYIDRTTVRNYNPFASEYFCCTDITIEINGKITSVAAIEYTLQEQLKPIYGYASRLYDDIAIGSRIVVGSLMIPVKNTANNPEFRNSDRSEENTPTNFNVDYDNNFNEERKKLALEERRLKKTTNESYKITLNKGTDLYLSPHISTPFMQINSLEEATSTHDLGTHLYCNIPKHNINCFVKKESVEYA